MRHPRAFPLACGVGKSGEGLPIRVPSRRIKVAEQRVNLKRRKQVRSIPLIHSHTLLEDNKAVECLKG